jgi:ASC-1-like (ASCH) protein
MIFLFVKYIFNYILLSCKVLIIFIGGIIMIRTIKIKQFPTFERAVIGGTYVSTEGDLYLVSDYQSENFIITNLTTSESTIHLNIEEVTEILKKMETRVTDVEIREVEKSSDFVTNRTLNAMVEDSPDF